MLRRLYLFTLSFLAIVQIILAQQGKISGRVFDDKGLPASGAEIRLYVGEDIVNGAISDDKGEYSIQPVDPGTYDLEVVYLEFGEKQTGIPVISGATRKVDFSLKQKQNVTTKEVLITGFKNPPYEEDPNAQGTILDNKQVKNKATRNINAVASITAGVYQSDEGDFSLSFRGARDGGTQYVIDGVKVRGTPSIPQSAIGQMQVITGGTPAEFGDFTGGVISITTAQPAPQISGGGELLTSELLDPYGKNLAAVNVSGPLWTKMVKFDEKDSLKYKRTILGFFASGEYDYNRDNDPAAFGLYKLDPNKLADYETNPVVYDPQRQNFVNRANFLETSDLQTVKTKIMNQDTRIRGLARLDFQPSNNISVKLGGSFEHINSNSDGGWDLRNQLLSPNAGSLYTGGSYRGWLRFQQQFKTSPNSAVKNFYYVLQADYSGFNRTFRNRDYLNNLWDYGYVGKFDYDRTPIYTYVSNPTGSPYTSGPYWETAAYGFRNLTYDRTGTRNEVFANANDYIFDYAKNTGIFIPDAGVTLNDLQNPFLLSFFNGNLNGGGARQIYSLFTGTGAQGGTYRKRSQEQFRLTGQATAEIGKHNLKVGFEFEQRVERDYNLGARGLWTFARLLANRQLQGLDRSNPTPVVTGGEFQDTINLPVAYDPTLQTNFDKQVRAALGMAANSTDWVNTDALTPEFFNSKSLGEWFTANEMLFNGQGPLGGYYGYTYDGKPMKRTDPGKFFSDTLNRPQNAFTPTYISAFIQDKFELEDIIFNLGLRVDRFDANQQVLADPYSLYPLFSASETANKLGTSLPAGIGAGTDWVAYVDDAKDPSKIVGYRSGDVWYDVNGAPTSSQSVAAASGGRALPHVKRDDSQEVAIDAFKDYKPQTIFMPRMSFSFPISDKALFFAHYDVLSQRPGQLLANQVSFAAGQLSDYLYLRTNPTIEIINPNLKPEITIDYEVGFRQKLNEIGSQALSISAYYREMRNMVQYRRFNNAYPITYSTYDNIDFGTVKGFTGSYVMRRTKHIELNVSYTLQFATATGSSFTSSRGVSDALQGTALLRTLLPTGQDQRHRITASVDYRYGDLAQEDKGPALKIGKKTFYPFSNAGANLTFILGSGTPFSRQLAVTSILDGQAAGGQTLGTPNSNRLPWQFRTDLRIDKNFMLGGKEKGFGELKTVTRKYGVNVYLLALNVLNTQNITGVYAFTGLPFDDGFLQSPQGAQTIQSQINPDSFTQLYQARLKNPNNVSMPRRIRLGMSFNF